MQILLLIGVFFPLRFILFLAVYDWVSLFAGVQVAMGSRRDGWIP